MLKFAITGNIASGKSQVENYLRLKGYPVYDADFIAHEILDNLNDFYGYDVFTNGKIDRAKLGELVFKNPKLKQKLEQIVHPLVKDKIIELFDVHKDDDFLFISVPLLYEAGFETMFDKVLLVTVDSELQLKRLMERNNYNEEQALVRINSQLSQDSKIKKADFVISNNASYAELNNKIDIFLSNISSLC